MIANQNIRTAEKSCKITTLKKRYQPPHKKKKERKKEKEKEQNRTEKKKEGEIVATQAKIFPEFGMCVCSQPKEIQ